MTDDSGMGKHLLHFQRNLRNPKEWLNFVELDGFAAAWKRLGLDDADLRSLQIGLCISPDGASVIQGTGGLRKLRFAPEKWNRGRSGAARIYYTYFPKHGLIALVYAHSKNEMEAISATQKKAIKSLIEEIQTYLDSPPARRRKST